MGPQLHLEAAPTGDVTIPRWAGLHLKLGRRGHWAYHQAPIVTCIIIRVKVEHLSKPAVTPETLLIDEVLSELLSNVVDRAVRDVQAARTSSVSTCS